MSTVFVYVLKSLSSGKFYTGMTMDLPKRIREHNTGKSKFTSRHMPWVLLYSEETTDWATASAREKYLKTTSGKKWIQKQLEEK